MFHYLVTTCMPPTAGSVSACYTYSTLQTESLLRYHSNDCWISHEFAYVYRVTQQSDVTKVLKVSNKLAQFCSSQCTKTCLISPQSFSGPSYFEFLLSPFVLASLFMLSFFSPSFSYFSSISFYFTLLPVAASRASRSIPRPSSLATSHSPLAALVRAPRLTTLAYDCSASRTAAQSPDQQAVRVLRHISSWGCWHSCGVWWSHFRQPNRTLYDGHTVWHQSQIQRRCKTEGCERLHPQRTFNGVVKVRLWT